MATWLKLVLVALGVGYGLALLGVPLAQDIARDLRLPATAHELAAWLEPRTDALWQWWEARPLLYTLAVPAALISLWWFGSD